MKKLVFVLAGATALSVLGTAWAQAPAPAAPAPKPVLAGALPEAASSKTLTVSSADFKADGMIPMANSGWGGGVSPALSWTKVAGAKSYVMLMEDADAARNGLPIQHWLVADIPGDAAMLPEGLMGASSAISQGKNVAGKNAYQGPHPPIGAMAHHYYFQVFALDKTTGLMPGWERPAILDAMKGHVLAKGELVGLAAAPADAKPPA
jgi:Raf kinase inhibitor-like YbhB/YbcL family protein